MSVRNWGPVRNCMRTKVTFVDGRLDVLQALKVMKREGTTSLMVNRRDDNDEYGLLLFSDIAKKVIAKNRAPERVNVYEIMAKPVIMVHPDMEIRYCARLFEKFGINTAPVAENGEVVGMVSYYRLVLHGLPDLD
ncbi:MAG: CBS domain-containing protein [Gammaproteobacteria bacterium]|nr:CBS domain-containing protein [Gammaproteobacteria bacterium]MBT8105028.1 CBS domain-containing protein [Gammaproteobacteria bacterium]NNF49951.1 CBS domain-containing protein [Woeseiaceae bacterium]NNK25042.1 CBS domain-containing protein [Woeseiaceae bacterium]NNL63562.1 CBS domain-containing protein [Woeseiaceae bacterium]